MVDTLVSGASASRRVGSTPIIRTKMRLDFFPAAFFLLRLKNLFFGGGIEINFYICDTPPKCRII